MRGDLPEWMIELAEQIKMIPNDAVLPRGVIVGSAIVDRCVALPPPPSCLSASVPSCLYQWHLADVQRIAHHRKPKRHPQPVWFKPF